jgi:hypothetical protein
VKQDEHEADDVHELPESKQPYPAQETRQALSDLPHEKLVRRIRELLRLDD